MRSDSLKPLWKTFELENHPSGQRRSSIPTIFHISRASFHETHQALWGTDRFVVGRRRYARQMSWCADWGFSLRKPDLKIIVHSFLERRNIRIEIFRDYTPGDDWVDGFLRRNENPTNRIGTNVTSRQASVSEETIAAYFQRLQESVDGVSAFNIVNYDETGFKRVRPKE